MSKILTVLVPVYNTEKYIKRCLDSVLQEEILDELEVLVVSDGSKDGAIDIVKEYQARFPNTVRLIEKENGGHGSTINKGIECASGKYFRVLDSDDWVNCLDFINFVKRLRNEDADIVVTNYAQEHIYDHSEVNSVYDSLEENIVYNLDEFDLKLLHGEYFVMATSTYKLSILKQSRLHLLEKTFYVDMQYDVVPIKYVKTFSYYNLNIYRYYIGRKDQSVNMSSYVRNKLHHERVMKFLIDYYTDAREELSENKREYIEIILIYMLYTHYTIFVTYDTNRKEAYRQIKEFDAYFKNKNISLYNRSQSLSMISAYRKFNFVFVKFAPGLFRKAFSIARRLKHI